MRPKTTAAALLLAALLALPACSSIEYSVVSGADGVAARKTNDDPFQVVTTGPIAIDVDSFNGNVTVTADPRVEHTTVTVTRRALHGWGRRDDADRSLQEIHYTAEIVPGSLGGPLGQVLRVETTTTHAEPHYQRADVAIVAPEIDGVRVRTSNGRVVVKNITGALDIASDDGNVRVVTGRPMVAPVSILNAAGDIEFHMSGKSTAELECRAIRGKVRHKVEQGSFVVHTGTTHDTLLGTLNGGGNPMLLRAADGDIRVRMLEAPTKVGRTPDYRSGPP